MVLLISYDLNGRERPSAYADVKCVIEANASSTKRPLYSQWFVETDDSPQAWFDRLKGVIDTNDKVFICEVHPPWEGRFSSEIGDCLKAKA